MYFFRSLQNKQHTKQHTKFNLIDIPKVERYILKHQLLSVMHSKVNVTSIFKEFRKFDNYRKTNFINSYVDICELSEFFVCGILTCKFRRQ